MTMKELKKGEFFKLKETSKQVYVKDYYDRSSKKYVAYNFNDICHFIEVPANREVFTDFIF